jgi:hypothetical protein
MVRHILLFFAYFAMSSSYRLGGGLMWGMIDYLQMRRPRNTCAEIEMWRKWFKRFKRRALGGQRRRLMSA